MTRDEILEKSRKENIGQDERERQVSTEAGERSGLAALLLCILVSAINHFHDGPRSVGAAATVVTLGAYAAREVHLAKKLATRQHKVCAVLFSVFTAVEFLIYLWYVRRGY